MKHTHDSDDTCEVRESCHVYTLGFRNRIFIPGVALATSYNTHVATALSHFVHLSSNPVLSTFKYLLKKVLIFAIW